MKPMKVYQHAVDAILRECAADRWAVETCGLLFGSDDTAMMAVKIRNLSQGDGYSMDPAEVFEEVDTWRHGKIRARLIGSWHSHPHGFLVPSELDKRHMVRNFYYLMVAPGGKMKVFERDGILVRELPVEVE